MTVADAVMSVTGLPEEIVEAITQEQTLGTMISSQFGIPLEDVAEWMERQTTCVPEEMIRKIEEHQQEQAQIAMDVALRRINAGL